MDVLANSSFTWRDNEAPCLLQKMCVKFPKTFTKSLSACKAHRRVFLVKATDENILQPLPAANHGDSGRSSV